MNLRKIRRARGLTAKELGEKVGKTESAICMYETGKREPSYETLLMIAEVLDCSVGDIIGEKALEDLGFTALERVIIQKYRTLDEYGKRAVEAVLDVEASRKVIDLNEYTMVARGGKKIPEGMEDDMRKMLAIMFPEEEK